MGKAKKETVKDAKAVRKSALRKPGTSGAAKDASKRGKAIVAEVLSRARAATAAKRDKGKEKGKQKETKKEEKKKDDKKETKEKDKRDKEKETKEKKDGAAAKEKQDKQEKDEKAKTHEGQKETAGKEKKKKDDKNEADANSATAKRSAMDGEGEGNKKKKAKASAEEKEKGEKLKALQSRLQQIVAPKTPPPKRVRMKSPSESVSTNASAQRYAINKAKAEAHFEKIKGSLDSALKDAENQAEFDALGMLDVLDELKHGKNDKKEKTAEKETKAKPKIEAEQKKDDERKKEEEAAEEMAQELEDEAEEDDEEEQTDDEQEDSEDDAPKTVVPRCETEEEDEEQEEEEEEEEEEEDGEPEAEEKNADEDEASADEESDDDGEEEGSEEAEPCADDDEEEEKEDKEESKGGKKEGRELGKTDKNAWDKFDRSRKTLKFPESLRPMLKRQKTELFNLWLENGRDWDKVACVVERQTETKNLARKQWTAVQAKTLKASMPEDRFQDLIKKRTEAGLYYKDDDYPDDELETWYYMPQGRVVRQDDSTSELLKVQAQKKLDRGMLNEMTGDDGPLQAGALPAVKAASIGGAQALLKALDDDGKKVTKPPKRRKDEETAEPVKPKTILELGSGMEALQIVLSKATTARQKSIQLKGVEFAGELATQMLGHAVEMEGEDSAKRIRPEPSSFRESALLHKFWNHLKSLPGFKYHTVLQSLTPEELKTSIPCCIHGDGAEMFRDDEFWVMNWSSAFASGYHYEVNESDEQFLKKVSFNMRQDCKDHKFSLHRNRSPSCEHLDQEDGEMQLLNVCAFSLAKAIELIDNSGLILSSEEASEPRPDRD
ncbi:Uncharacterized protein SCF082_LOCUS25020 [Durusdinium trenchii]|uniref:Myb-like domain-containing protein n=1 Tax=Durusdinium trenchii TaxID=1381693 RepID=A0ABP0LYB0_9DINO